jgi:hypothetical protein
MNNSVCSVKENTMKRISVFAVVVLMVLAFVSAAWAIPFPTTDVRALGMGGAFVAAGEGIGAVNYNPALLAKDSTVGVVLPEIVARIEDHIGMVDLIDDLNDPATLSSATAAANILDKLAQGGETDIMAYGGIGAGFGIFGISGGVTYADLIFGTVFPQNIDAGNLSPAANTNTLEFRGIEARQLIFTGAKSFGNIIVGANMRKINATTYSDSESLFSDPDIGVGDVTEGTESDESAIAWDIGAVMGLTTIMDVGIVARDVGGTDLGVIEFDPRYRIGAAFYLPTLTIAADYDITEIEETNTAYQEWAIGGEFDVWAIALRAGMSKNQGLSGAPTLVHFGLGLGFLDIGAAYAEDGDYYMAGVNLSLGF